MKFQIRHEIRGRMRIHVIQSRMSFAQADTLQYYLEQCESVISAKIQNRTEDVTICYEGSKDAILEVLKAFSYEKTDVPDTYIRNSGREMNQHYWDQLVEQTFWHFGTVTWDEPSSRILLLLWLRKMNRMKVRHYNDI